MGATLLVAQQQEPGEVRIAHLHLVNAESTQWRNYLHFRNRLRRDPALREEYARLKQRLAALFPEDRAAYTRGKAGFMQEVLEGAREDQPFR